MNENAKKTHHFRAEVSQVLDLVINSLYSNKEVFLRELISNSADALDKLRFESISKPELLPKDYQPLVRLIPDKTAKTLTISDNGVGMNREDLVRNLGTVAHSGSQEFIQKLKEAKEAQDLRLIGQFGVGFYSCFMLAKEVEVVSRKAGSETAFRWRSDGKESFTVEPAERDSIGTSVIVHLKDEEESYLSEWRLRTLVSRYSDFINHPIELWVERIDKDQKTEAKFEAINQASALWKRTPKDITDQQYEEFYKHLTYDAEGPFAKIHFTVEGKRMFTGLLYIPKHPPIDLFYPDSAHGVRLYVRRVFIMEDCKELLPRWLRFVRGVVDSDDLPLNVSREMLQDSEAVRTIRKQIMRRVLDLLTKQANDAPEAYLDFWGKFGAVLKEGLHFDPDQKSKLANLLRYDSTASETLVSLSEYIKRMPMKQKAIYFAIGASKEILVRSPHLEGLKKRGYEVLLMTDAIDQWAVEGLSEFEGKPLVNAMEEGLDLEEIEKEEDKTKSSDQAAEETVKPDLAPLLAHFKTLLSQRVSEVRLSDRLTDSPTCLVIPKGGLPSHLERFMRATQPNLPQTTKPIFEINPDHRLIKRINEVFKSGSAPEQLDEWIELLYDQALLTEGSPIDDPVKFADIVTRLLQSAVDARANP
jgi:molecular chaperone HtpG